MDNRRFGHAKKPISAQDSGIRRGRIGIAAGHHTFDAREQQTLRTRAMAVTPLRLWQDDEWGDGREMSYLRVKRVSEEW